MWSIFRYFHVLLFFFTLWVQFTSWNWLLETWSLGILLRWFAQGTFLEGRCHLKPWWTSLTIRSPSASVLWLPCWLSGKETACIAGDLQETWVWSLGWEDHPEKEIVTHSSILAWEIPWTKEPGGATVHGWQRVEHSWVTKQQQYPF